MNKKLIALLLVLSCSVPVKSMEVSDNSNDLPKNMFNSSSKLLKDITIHKLLELKKDAEENKNLNKATMHYELCRCIARASTSTSDIQINSDLTQEQLELAPHGFLYLCTNNESKNTYYLNPCIADAFYNDADNESPER